MALEINKNSEFINVYNLASGVYSIRYSMDSTISTFKFL